MTESRIFKLSNRMTRAVVVTALLVDALITPYAAAAPVTFNTALPVAKGEFLWRELFRYRERDADTGQREVTAWALANVLGYGIRGDLALFGTLPYVHKELNAAMPGGVLQREDGGPGDLRLFARYTAFALNQPGWTLRLAPFAGLIAPTGEDDQPDTLGPLPKPLQPGLGSWGGFAGVVTSYQALQFEVDSQIQYEFRGAEDHFAGGDVFRFDTSLQFRVWPWTLSSGAPGFLYLVLESNFEHQDRDRMFNSKVAASGGERWFLTPGIQFATRRYVLETVLQLPVSQKVHGNLQDDFAIQAGFRFVF